MKRSLSLLLIIAIMLLPCCKEAYTTETKETTSQTENSTEPVTDSSEEATTEAVTEPTEAETVAQTEPPTEPVTEPTVIYDENGFTPRALMYHLVMEVPYNNNTTMFVRPTVFAEQLSAMNEAGYSYLFADEYGKTVDQSVILTFDDGYEDNYTTMFPILKEHGAKATVFLIGDLINTPGYLTTEQIKEMSDSGYVRFGCHTMSHCYLAAQTPERARAEIADCVALVEEITGKECNSIAYPNGSYNGTVNDIASEYVSYAYNSHDRMPDGEEDSMHIPRIYVSRQMSAEQLVSRIG